MNIQYKITYLPHLENNTPPYYYIGSKYNYQGNYFGSPSSKQKDWFTGDLSISKWWKKEIKENKQNFKFEILKDCGDITPQLLVEEEKSLHLKLNVKTDYDYFNKSIATTGWVSIPRTDKTKKIISEKTKAYWDSEEGQLKKQRLIASNKKYSSDRLKRQRQEYPEKFISTESSRKKSSESIKAAWASGKFDNKKPREQRKINGDGNIFVNAFEAAKYAGIHPVNIRKRCRSDKFPNWFYLE
jgi:hypothetical protein